MPVQLRVTMVVIPQHAVELMDTKLEDIVAMMEEMDGELIVIATNHNSHCLKLTIL